MFWRDKVQPKSIARCLFLLKNQSSHGYGHKASGLRNSAIFVSDMLSAAAIISKVVVVTDNNDIDREVTQFNATHVFIEALWVVPEKFEILRQLHPNVKWIVRIHSEIPFLALEGIAVDWIRRYEAQPNVFVAANSLPAQLDLSTVVGKPILYLPNFYPQSFQRPKAQSICGELNVGCFGAIRPMKNHLEQAIAAVQFADKNNLKLNFHINASKIEDGDAILKNLRALFSAGPHKLIEHDWFKHSDFLKYLRGIIDLVMAVSFTETFSIVAADAVSQGVPVVGSKEISWLSEKSIAHPTDSVNIVNHIVVVLNKSTKSTKQNQQNLNAYSDASRKLWLKFLI